MKTTSVTFVQKIALLSLATTLTAGPIQAEILQPKRDQVDLCPVLALGFEALIDPNSTKADIAALLGPVDGLRIPDGIPREAIGSIVAEGLRVTFNPKTKKEKTVIVPFRKPGGRLTFQAIELLQEKLTEMITPMVVGFGMKVEKIEGTPDERKARKLFEKHFPEWVQTSAGQVFVLIRNKLDDANRKRSALNSSSFRLRTDKDLNSPQVQPYIQDFMAVLALMEGWSQEQHPGESKLRGLIKGLLGSFSVKRKNRPSANNWLTETGEKVGIGGKNKEALDPMVQDAIDNSLHANPKMRVDAAQASPLYDGEVAQPEEITNVDLEIDVELDNRKLGGATPKLSVLVKGQAYKLKYALPAIRHKPGSVGEWFNKLLGSSDEALTETGINLILKAIGYTIQPTYPKNSVRLRFKGISTFEKFKEKLADVRKNIESGSKAAWAKNLDLVFTEGNIGVDEKGAYLRINGVSMEASSGEETYIGSFDSETLQMLVQGRAIALLDALFGNADQKDGNRSLMAKVRTDDSTGRKSVVEVIYGLNDMGFAFGTWWWVKNAPNLFKWDLVDFEKTTENRNGGLLGSDEFITTFNAYFSSELFKVITPDDAKWLVKRLGQLKLSQLVQFFEAAKYPIPVAHLIAHKIHYRIAGLIDALGMDGARVRVDGPGEDYVFLKGRAHLNYMPETFSVPGYERCFKNGDLIPCDAVPARYTLNNPFKMFSSAFKDARGDVAPQIQLLKDLPGAIVGQAKSLMGTIGRMIGRLTSGQPQ